MDWTEKHVAERMAFVSSVVLQPSCIRLEVCARRRRGRVWCTEGADGVHNKDQLGGLSGGNDRRKRNLKRVEPPKLLYLRESDKGDDEYPLVLEVCGFHVIVLAPIHWEVCV